MPFGDLQMQLSYAADINRPNYWVLRSGVQYSNHYTYETGNPFLVSEISRNISYDLAYKWLTFNLTYEHVSDPIYQTVVSVSAMQPCPYFFISLPLLRE